MAVWTKFDRYNAEDVGEVLSVLLVVGDFDLYFLVATNGLGYKLDDRLIHCWPECRFHTARRLQKAAVPAQNLVAGVASQFAEGVRGVDYGCIWEFEIAEDKRDGTVNGPELDHGMWPTFNLHLLCREHYEGEAGEVVRDIPRWTLCQNRWGSRDLGK